MNLCEHKTRACAFYTLGYNVNIFGAKEEIESKMAQMHIAHRIE